MAHFANFNYLDAQDEFLNDEDSDKYNWDFTSTEVNSNFDQGDDTWSQMSMNSMDIDDMYELKEELDNFNGVF